MTLAQHWYAEAADGPWQLPEGSYVLSVSGEFISDTLTRYGHRGPVHTVVVSLRFRVHGATVLRRFQCAPQAWEKHCLPLMAQAMRNRAAEQAAPLKVSNVQNEIP